MKTRTITALTLSISLAGAAILGGCADSSIDAVEESGALETAVNVGDRAPDFTLPDAEGNQVTLASLLDDGPVVLTWYRGGWCPYCNRSLREFQGKLDEIKAAGAQLVAISPETPDKSLSTEEKNNLNFTVLSDVGSTVAKRYGVAFKLDPETDTKYQRMFSLHEWNKDKSGTLPLPATYVIDENGQITWAYINADYKERANPDDVVAALRTMN